MRILHHKTGELVWLPSSDEEGPLFPELTAYLDELDRLGVPIVLLKPKGKEVNPHGRSKCAMPRTRFERRPREKVLLADLTSGRLPPWRSNELGNAELTEQGVMALSGHRPRRPRGSM